MPEGSDRYADIKDRLAELAGSDGDILAVIAIGSSTRTETPADEFSDLDLIIVTKDTERWCSGEYPARLGSIDISFIEPTLGGGRERRCIYDGGRDVDMIIFTPGKYEKALADGVAQWVMNRGYSFLYGAERYSELTERYVKTGVSHAEMSEEEFQNLVNDFYFHNIWACKKLMRGELWSAKMCIDGYLKQRLLTIIEQYQLAETGADVWHDGRFLDRWAGSDITEALKRCFARYDSADCKSALDATHELFSRLAVCVADKYGFAYPERAQAAAEGFLRDAAGRL